MPYPKGTFLSLPLLRENALYFVHCLRSSARAIPDGTAGNNALIPIGIGFLDAKDTHLAGGEFHAIAAGSFVLLTIASYAVFVTKKEKG